MWLPGFRLSGWSVWPPTERGRCVGRGMMNENLDVFSVGSWRGKDKGVPTGVDTARSLEGGLCWTDRLGAQLCMATVLGEGEITLYEACPAPPNSLHPALALPPDILHAVLCFLAVSDQRITRGQQCPQDRDVNAAQTERRQMGEIF